MRERPCSVCGKWTLDYMMLLGRGPVRIICLPCDRDLDRTPVPTEDRWAGDCPMFEPDTGGEA